MAQTIASLALTSTDDIKILRHLCKAITESIGFKPFLATRIITCALELARNVIEHGGGGHAQVSLTEPRGGHVVLRMIFADQGPGIDDLAAAMPEDRGPAKGRGLGLGLGGVKHMADDFDLKTGHGGTRVRADFVAPVEGAEMPGHATSAADRCDEILMQQGSADHRIRQLEAELDERDLMIGEVHHRTANNLTMIASLVRMEQRRAQSDETRAVLGSLGIRVEAMARTHKLLQTTEEEAVEARTHLTQIASLAQSFERSDLTVTVHVNADETRLPAKLALDLGLITGELITNAYKHAFHGRSEGSISITLATEGDMIRYGFHDDGAGLGEAQNPERSGSLGWRMLRSTVAGNMGHLSVDGTEGLKVDISFPVPA